jgi:hypothetical protein
MAVGSRFGRSGPRLRSGNYGFGGRFTEVSTVGVTAPTTSPFILLLRDSTSAILLRDSTSSIRLAYVT